ncbi:ABC transporter ATP-binding protein [Leifsonia naganoensis]|uniref:Oligopeptide/dipeptide ABC transporter ATP-binding protein n=1 Tax=Leifsonia naganoensis TaxID=150025 RepID=A0A853DQP9_9MICO|nr:ABC transporter ATP-binding protein [Leifsonia naganoensis]NYK10577.1 oligopeptide/dipeptide ABC transporter ATP-binding protein [Leifsonia naganoensis]
MSVDSAAARIAGHASATGEPILQVDDLQVTFSRAGGLGRRSTAVPAVQGVSFALEAGTTLGIAGESGSGKSTIARTLMRITKPSGGSMRLDGRDVGTLRGKELARYRQTMQMIFQDPYDSLDPRMKVSETLMEAIKLRTVKPISPRAEVFSLLEKVGLSASFASRRPGELSGGQRQRVSIARALCVDPRLILCDEAVSALDVSVRAQVLNLLKDLQEELGLAYLFISHDLSTLRFMADYVGIMYLGKLVELGTRDEVFSNPQHPYTRALLSAVPEPVVRDRESRAPRVRLTGEPPSAANPPSGCSFHPRCPLAQEICRTTSPASRITASGQRASCHFADPVDDAARETTGAHA